MEHLDINLVHKQDSLLIQFKEKMMNNVKTIDLGDEKCSKLLTSKGLLYCIHNSKIEIRKASSGEVVKKVDLPSPESQFVWIVGADFAPNQEDIYIAAWNRGLLHYSAQTDSIRQVIEGGYYAVLVAGTQLIAVRGVQQGPGESYLIYLDQFSIEDRDLTVLQVKKTNIKDWGRNGKPAVSLAGSSKQIFMANWGDDKIHELDKNLVKIRTFGKHGLEKAGELFGPILCTFEPASGLLLVADFDNNRFQLLDVNTGKWAVVKREYEPVSAVFPEHGKFYYANDSGTIGLCEFLEEKQHQILK